MGARFHGLWGVAGCGLDEWCTSLGSKLMLDDVDALTLRFLRTKDMKFGRI